MMTSFFASMVSGILPQPVSGLRLLAFAFPLPPFVPVP
jgi:hypothetical protein